MISVSTRKTFSRINYKRDFGKDRTRDVKNSIITTINRLHIQARRFKTDWIPSI